MSIAGDAMWRKKLIEAVGIAELFASKIDSTSILDF
jgi:hypothetical protein